MEDWLRTCPLDPCRFCCNVSHGHLYTLTPPGKLWVLPEKLDGRSHDATTQLSQSPVQEMQCVLITTGRKIQDWMKGPVGLSMEPTIFLSMNEQIVIPSIWYELLLYTGSSLCRLGKKGREVGIRGTRTASHIPVLECRQKQGVADRPMVGKGGGWMFFELKLKHNLALRFHYRPNRVNTSQSSDLRLPN